jgi:Rod binding domain-containing protein
MDVAPAASCQISIEASGPKSSGCKTNDPQSVHKVAQEFESLMIGELLKSMKTGSLSPASKDADNSMMQYAQESLARTMSQSGGFGLASLIEKGLVQKSQQAVQAGAVKSAGTSSR